jgi:hypothetical protein
VPGVRRLEPPISRAVITGRASAGECASRLAQERDTPSCRAIWAILVPEAAAAAMMYRFAMRPGVMPAVSRIALETRHFGTTPPHQRTKKV